MNLDPTVQRIVPRADDVLADELASLNAYFDRVMTAYPKWYNDRAKRKRLPEWKQLTGRKAPQLVPVLMAARQLAEFHGREARRVFDLRDVHYVAVNDSIDTVIYLRELIRDVLTALLQKDLPLTVEMVQSLLEWSAQGAYEFESPVLLPYEKAFRRLVGHASPAPLVPYVRQMHEKLLLLGWRDDIAEVEAWLRILAPTPEEISRSTRSPPLPAPVGHPDVLVEMKRRLGIGTVADAAPYLDDDARDLTQTAIVARSRGFDPNSLSPRARSRLALAIADHCATLALQERINEAACSEACAAFKRLSVQPAEHDRSAFFDFCIAVAELPLLNQYRSPLISPALEKLEQLAQQAPFHEGERFVLHRLRLSIIKGTPLGVPDAHVRALNELIGDDYLIWLQPCDVWAEAVNDQLSQASLEDRKLWTNVLQHAAKATGARPSSRWLAAVGKSLEAIPADQRQARLLDWYLKAAEGSTKTPFTLPLTFGRTDGLWLGRDRVADCLRGLVWMAPLVRSRQVEQAIEALARFAREKVSGFGVRAGKVGNACIYALSQIAGTRASSTTQ